MLKHEKGNKEVLHPRVLGQHPMRLPPPYLPQESYKDIFEAITKLEEGIQKEIKVKSFAKKKASGNYFIMIRLLKVFGTIVDLT